MFPKKEMIPAHMRSDPREARTHFSELVQDRIMFLDRCELVPSYGLFFVSQKKGSPYGPCVLLSFLSFAAVCGLTTSSGCNKGHISSHDGPLITFPSPDYHDEPEQTLPSQQHVRCHSTNGTSDPRQGVGSLRPTRERSIPTKMQRAKREGDTMVNFGEHPHIGPPCAHFRSSLSILAISASREFLPGTGPHFL